MDGCREQFPELYGEDGDARFTALLDDDTELPRAHAIIRARLEPGDPPEVDDTVITWLFEPETFAPLARLTNADAHAIVADHTDAPLVVLDADGNLATHLVHDTSGHADVRGDAALCPFRFAGQYIDAETGLHENRFRYYDPGSGRYLSRDPIGLRGGLGVYGYVADPVGWVDPLGLAGTPSAGADCGAGVLKRDLTKGPHAPDTPIGKVIDRAQSTKKPQGRWSSTDAAKRAAARATPGQTTVPISPGDGTVIHALPGGGILIRDATRAVTVPKRAGSRVVWHTYPVD